MRPGVAKALARLGNVAVTLGVAAALLAGVGSLVWGRPVLATVVKSDSMAPLLRRGDVVFLWNWPKGAGSGDVVLFRPSRGALAGEWVLHRIVGVDAGGAFFTKGDAAAVNDQDDGLAGPVPRGEIAARALTLGRLPLKVPRIGALGLNLNSRWRNLRLYAWAPALALGTALSVPAFFKRGRRSRRAKGEDPRPLFAGVGAAVSLLLAAMTLFQTTSFVLLYEVRPEKGVIVGQPVGIITPGQVVRRQLARVENRGFLPMVLLVTESDPNLTVDAGLEMVAPGASRDVRLEVRGAGEGAFKAPVEMSLVFPLLPPAVVAALARVNHWLGALAGCLWPGLAVLLVGFLEPAVRRRTGRDLRAARRRILGRLPW